MRKGFMDWWIDGLMREGAARGFSAPRPRNYFFAQEFRGGGPERGRGGNRTKHSISSDIREVLSASLQYFMTPSLHHSTQRRPC
jgi:hypothetical protein